MTDHPIPEGTRPLAVYRHEADHIAVMFPGEPPMIMRPGDSLVLRYEVVADPDGQPMLRYVPVDG